MQLFDPITINITIRTNYMCMFIVLVLCVIIIIYSIHKISA
jgi:hypothetical protein